MLMSAGWLKPLNTLTCENLVTPLHVLVGRLEYRVETLQDVAVDTGQMHQKNPWRFLCEN